MEVEFDDEALDRLETDSTFMGSYPPEVVKAYRKAMGWIRAATDERDFFNLKGLRYEKLRRRPGQHSMRLNAQFRLIVEYRGGNPKRIVIVSIEDYH